MWVKEHPGWTYKDFDEMTPSDRLLHQEFEKMLAGL